MSRAELLAPTLWPTWIGILILRLLERLPHRPMMFAGRMIGRIARHVAVPFARVARRNMELCLPELSPSERERLLDLHFQHLGMGLCETAMSWWSSDERILSLAQIEGREHLDRALASGRGVILLSAHFTTLEIGARIAAAVMPINVMYRPQKNKLIAAVSTAGRSSRVRKAIRRDDVRTMIRVLKDSEIVWYAPDQSYRKKGAEMVRFFGIPAASNTSTSRLARITGAAVMMFSHERLPRSQGYRIVIHPPLENFPSDDPVADTERFHQFIESEVRRNPEQFWWIHRRFKGLSADYPDYYSRSAPPAPAVAPQS